MKNEWILQTIQILNVTSTMLAPCVVAVKVITALQLDLPNAFNAQVTSIICLFLFFIAAGIILVILILILNVTVTQGLINGPIFYANLLWTYKDILFPSELQSVTFVVLVFIAWLNLDFGIEMCLVRSWSDCLLENVVSVSFPTLHLVHCWSNHHWVSLFVSLDLYLFGDRAVPLLSTLFLLSYTNFFILQ